MSGVETILPREGAAQASVHSTAIYRAVDRGLIQVQRSGGRIYLIKASFEHWRERLEAKRRIREAERQLVGA